MEIPTIAKHARETMLKTGIRIPPGFFIAGSLTGATTKHQPGGSGNIPVSR
jgi:hypothetical protein